MLRQMVLSRAYFSKYFYVGSQGTLHMLIKAPNLVESLPRPHVDTTLSLHRAACAVLQVVVPGGLQLQGRRALASLPCFETCIFAGRWLCCSESLWLAGGNEGSRNHAAVGSSCNGFYLCEIRQLKS